jgi:hypothetical protein
MSTILADVSERVGRLEGIMPIPDTVPAEFLSDFATK